MSFRVRLLAAFVAAASLPLALFAHGVRRESEARMEAEFRSRAEAMARVLQQDLRREGASVERRLAALAERMTGDNRLRLALRRDADRDVVLDFAGQVMDGAGLDALQLQDADGRILSSGHYRNEYGRRVPGLARGVAESPDGVALATLRRPEGPFLALVAARRARVGDRSLWLLGGLSVRDRLLPRLARAGGISVTLELPGAGEAAGGPAAVAGGGPDAATDDTVVLDRVTVPHFRLDDASGAQRGRAAFVVAHTLAPLRRLRAGNRRWLGWALAGSAALAVLLAWWISARISRPLESLAAGARRLRLEGGDVDFDRERDDEVGELARTLDEAHRRLRASAARLKEAERRATIGEMARQVNHDIRNGLAPLRNVVRHLSEAAREAPDRLASLFREREDTLDAALSYLEELAGQYERISSRPEPGACDVNAAVRDVADGTDPGGERVRTELADGLPAVEADPVALRRILENLVRNGLQAVEDRSDGRVTLATGPADGAGGGPAGEGPDAVRITVADNGPGLPEEEREAIFRDFHTTRRDGTGLGLSIVRRLVTDLDGTLEVESEPGRGATFVVELPAAAGADRPETTGGEP